MRVGFRFVSVAVVAFVLALAVALGPGAASQHRGATAMGGAPLAFVDQNPPGVVYGITVMNVDGSGRHLLTRTATEETAPAWSPDGQRIAFASDSGIWVMGVDGGGRRRITSNTWDDAPAWSPDGSSIAFDRNVDLSSLNATILVASVDGTGERRITVGDTPSWSPDGETLVFARNFNGRASELFLVRMDGSGLLQLTRNDVSDTDPAWSPDGKTIAFVRDDHLFVMNADGSNARPLAGGGDFAFDEHPSWALDGSRIMFARKGDIYVVGRDGSNLRRLTNDATGSLLRRPSWAPDGSRFAYADAIDSEIWVLKGGGTRFAAITHNGADDHSPVWSPSARRIAFVSADKPDIGTARWNVFVANADGTGLRRLTHTTQADGLDPVAWAADGTRIAFTSGSGLFVVSASGTAERRLVRGDLLVPAWSPDTRKIAFGVLGSGGLRVDVVNADGTARNPLTPFLGSDLHRVDFFAIEWSPDGRHLAFSIGDDRGKSHLYVMQTDGDGRRMLSGYGEDPTWSPDGSQLAFTGSRGIWIADASGTNARQLSRDPLDATPQWSPNGKEIAYANRQSGIWITQASHGRPRLVARVPGAHDLTWSRH